MTGFQPGIQKVKLVEPSFFRAFIGKAGRVVSENLEVYDVIRERVRKLYEQRIENCRDAKLVADAVLKLLKSKSTQLSAQD